MGGRCSLNRSVPKPPNNTHPNVDYSKRKRSQRSHQQGENVRQRPYFIVTSDGHLRYNILEPYCMNQTMDTHSSQSDNSMTLTYKRLLYNGRNTEHKLKSGENFLSNDGSSESSVTITVDENSTSGPESLEECALAVELEPNTNLNKNPSQNVRSKDTNLHSEILNQVKKLVNMDNSETKAVAEQLLNYLTKLPWSEQNKTCRKADFISRSTNLDMSVNQNSVNITSEPLKDCDYCDWLKTNPVPADSENLGTDCESSKQAWIKDGENEATLSGSWNSLVDAIGRILQNDENTKCPEFDVIEYSKQQVMKTHRKSLLMTEVLDNMPSLAKSVTSNRRYSSKYLQNKDECLISKGMNFVTMTSKIDELDKKITDSKQKLTMFRRKALDLLLADGDDSDESAEEGKNLSLLHVEKEILRWQDHKNKLGDYRTKIITNLNRELIGNFESDDVVCDRLTSDSLSEDSCATSNRCPSEANSMPI